MAQFVIEGGLRADARRKIAAALSPLVEADAPLLLELLIVSTEEIRELNARERHIDRVTDVLSFPTMELVRGEKICLEEHGECIDEKGRLVLGSIVLCKERAKEQAEEFGHSLAREMGYLIVHGALHCLGYDHEEEDDRAQMRALEEKVMDTLDLRRGE